MQPVAVVYYSYAFNTKYLYEYLVSVQSKCKFGTSKQFAHRLGYE